MRRHAARILLTASAIVSGSIASAQDAVPETPPELRDFRLDQPSPQPDPAPPVATPVTPPPVVRTVPEPTPEGSAQTPARQRAEPRQRGQTQQTAPTEQPVNDVAASPAPSVSVEPATEAQTATVPPSITTDTSAIAPAANEPVADEDGWLWTGILGSALALALFVFLLRRRRKKDLSLSSDAALSPAPEKPASEPGAPPLQDPAARPSPPVPTVPMPSRIAPRVSVQFIPEKATISFTALTVKGQLQIANEGNAATGDMKLRAVLLSASNQQQQAIDSFFADPAQVEPTALGAAKPGERLGLALELSVPLSEMQSFPLGDQRLLVPILIATLSYSDKNGEPQEARLACMIGREAQPPQAKMGPLRLDKGPRSFAPLGQRPMHT